ncbi:tetratricopeptide repeat protein [Aquimarina aquimarini]|uniref:tetratricopeptide repeat protein n=1 Tax=Aquimarina aquimarini TaxID=1191734 RepID=UPI000D55296F|nr:tetratricopeptide repeat protein [Aquimarina aquimarini]
MMQLKRELSSILTQLDNSNDNKQELGYEALSIIDAILSENPFDVDVRVDRMRLNTDWVFSNSQEIIQDAKFFIENEAFGKNKLVGYEWLVWVYDEIMGLPEKVVEMIEEQLVEVHSLYDKRFEKDKLESELLNKMAIVQYNNDQKEEALALWEKSFDRYPYIIKRNGFVGMLFLENRNIEKAKKFILTHYDWSYDYEDDYRLQYGIKLKELYDNKELDNHPSLIGLLFNIIRNEKGYFKIEGKLDFYEQYFPEIEKWAELYPRSAIIKTVLAHTYFFDTKNYEKAFIEFSKMLECDKTIHYTGVDRIIKATKKSGNDFFELKFKFEGLSSVMYNAMTDLSSFADKAKKKKTQKRYIELAVQFGEVGYNQYHEYLDNGTGDTYNNQPHMFAMLCNNYANALGRYAELFLKKEEKENTYNYAGQIHIEGYKTSQFVENIENASMDFFKGKNYKDSIKYSLETLQAYREDLNVYDFQFHYYQIVRSYIKLDDIVNAEKYYQEAKKLYEKVGRGSKDANYNFIFASKLFYTYVVSKKKEYSAYIEEIEWWLDQEVAKEQEPKEHGLVSYYLGVCYKETLQKEKAINAFQVTVDYLQDTDWEFYEEKCNRAEGYIKALGGKVIKNKNKEKGIFARIIQVITFPFMLIFIIGGMIYAMANGKSKGKKKNKG